MRVLLLCGLLLVPVLTMAQTSYTLPVTEAQDQMLTFMAQREGKTNLQKAREFCAAGFAPAREQYRKLIEEGRTGALKQMTPQARAIVCAEFLAVGAPCPVEEP